MTEGKGEDGSRQEKAGLTAGKAGLTAGKGEKAGTLIEYILEGIDDFVVYGYLVVEVRAG